MSDGDKEGTSKIDHQKVNDFICKTIIALLAVFLVSSHSTFGQIVPTWSTSDTNATVDVSDGTFSNLSSGDLAAILNTHNLAFANAGHILTITDDDEEPGGISVTTLGNITTVTGGGGTLIFDLENSSTILAVGNIGNSVNRRVTTVEIRNDGSSITADNVFAGTLTINSGQALTVNGATNAETLINNGTLSTGSGRVGILGGSESGNIKSTGALRIDNTTSGGYKGTINAGSLTLYQGLFKRSSLNS